MKGVSIHSDGFGSGTVIIDEEGHRLEGIKSAAVFLDANDVNTVTFELVGTPLILNALISGITAHCPACNHALEHKCEEQLGGQPDTLDDDEVMTFKIQEITAQSGVGLMSGNGYNMQFATLKLKRVNE